MSIAPARQCRFGVRHLRRTVPRMARIMTTHAGSLPRPRALDVCWARHARGERVDQAELDALIVMATRNTVAYQALTGLDVAGNGEQGRESFFTHVREGFSGFGGAGDVRPFRDFIEFPD